MELQLNVSPFGDFETWIQESSMIAYLEAYPGRELPIDEKAAKAGFAVPASSNTDSNTNATDNNNSNTTSVPTKKAKSTSKAALKKAKGKAKAKVVKYPTGDNRIRTSIVSSNTISNASAQGRDSQSSQFAIMGNLSATTVATKYVWQDPDTRIAGVVSTNPTGKTTATDQDNIVWDNPGVIPAEWLHRTAYSFGSSLGPEDNSTPENFVFGSSEANSLMTRYEKSWQWLLRLDNSYNNLKIEAEKARLSALDGGGAKDMDVDANSESQSANDDDNHAKGSHDNSNSNNNNSNSNGSGSGSGSQNSLAGKGSSSKMRRECTLITVNTFRDSQKSASFFSQATRMNGQTKSLQKLLFEWEESSQSVKITTETSTKGVKTSEEVRIAKGQVDFNDYWDWIQQSPALCFALDYRIELPILLNITFGINETVFYPFLRGFFTRLEADIDLVSGVL